MNSVVLNFSDETVGFEKDADRLSVGSNLLSKFFLLLATVSADSYNLEVDKKMFFEQSFPPAIEYKMGLLEEPLHIDNANESSLLSDYYEFVNKFLTNAKEMDAKTAKLINKHYLELLAK